MELYFISSLCFFVNKNILGHSSLFVFHRSSLIFSVLRGMRIKDINSKVKGRIIQLKSYPGSNSKQLNYYVKRSIKYLCNSL